jgi:aminoglycoside 3-N-acetyltransferase
MIGCGLKPNTTMHAIEEYIQPAYLFGTPQTYTVTDSQGKTFEKVYIPHHFMDGKAVQRYDRVEGILDGKVLSSGKVGNARTFLIQAETLYKAALACMQVNPFYFVDIASS